jgi:hypothetical protein
VSADPVTVAICDPTLADTATEAAIVSSACAICSELLVVVPSSISDAVVSARPGMPGGS